MVGLTLARLLRMRGEAPVVVERMPEGTHVRRGFMLGHHGYDAMAEVGLMETIRSAGRPIGTQPDGSSAAIAIDVGTVLQGLAADLSIMFEHSVGALERDPSGRVTGAVAEGPDGATTIPCDLVVACDGIRSRVREMAGLAADFAPMAEGKIEWMSPVSTPESFAMAYLSNGGHIGLLSWPEGSFGWRTTDRVGREGALAPGIEALIDQWSTLLPAATEGVASLDSMERVFYSEPELLSCPRWWTPGAVVIGDAAHFFGPETGASAGIGIGDAHALAAAIAANPDDPDRACTDYEAWRGPVVRSFEQMDPGRRRLLGAAIPEATSAERWPPGEVCGAGAVRRRPAP